MKFQFQLILIHSYHYNTMLIAQVTDPHIKAEGRLAYKRIDSG